MTTPVFASAYKKVADRTSAMSMLCTLLPQWESKSDALRADIKSAPDVAPGLVALANDDAQWARIVSSSRSHRASRSSLLAAREIAESAVRILRPLPQSAIDTLPRVSDEPGSGPHPDAELKARVAAAYVLKMQLEHFGENTFPHIYMSNAAAHLMVGRDTVRDWFRWAVDCGLLYEQDAPAARKPGHWNVLKLGEKDEPLTGEEDAIASALTGKWSEVAADGTWGHLAADVLLSIRHVAWGQYPRSVKGFRQWWATLQVAARRPVADVSTADEMLAESLAIRRISDVDALVTVEGQERYNARQAKRAAEREAAANWVAATKERNDDAWEVIRESLGWAEWTADDLVAWCESAVQRLAEGNRRGWQTATDERPGSVSDARASVVRDSLVYGVSNSTRFTNAPDKQAAIRLLREAPVTRAERNLHEALGWGAVRLDDLVTWTQSAVLRLAGTSDTYLEESIRSSLHSAITRNYPPSEERSAALDTLKGAA